MSVVIGGTASRHDQALGELVAAKGSDRIAACIPARNEAATVGRVVATASRLRDAGLLDEIVVIDDGSIDETSAVALAAGATVIAAPTGPGKGEALRHGVESTVSELIVFLDADVSNFGSAYITELVSPLLIDPNVQLVKASYARPLAGVAGEGGRVTEILARPLLARFFPELATIGQPLAGESAIRRTALSEVALSDGYGIEIALLIDIHRRYGRAAIAEADLGERVHRNRPLHQLTSHAEVILRAVLDRVDPLPLPKENSDA